MLLPIALPIVAFVVIEGGSSLVVFTRDAILSTRPVNAQEVSTEYDPELGWVAKKSFSAPDMYGPGVSLHTNDRGFRGKKPIADAMPVDKHRVVCSGDSFTLGLAVADHEAWCSLLDSEDLETVNMGQGAYGVDQAYLWYKRDARTLEHSVHLLSWVTHDFERMASNRFLGFAKPMLAVRGDSLVVVGAPVPRDGDGRALARLGRTLESLRTAQLITRLSGPAPARLPRAAVAETRAGTREVMARLVADLARVNSAKGSQLVLVHLPDHTDYLTESALPWRERMRAVADSLDVPFVDLIPELRTLTRTEVDSLYFQRDHGRRFAGAVGHLTPAGNRWVAERLRRHLHRLGVLSRPLADARRR